MPFLKSKVSFKVDKSSELKVVERIGRAIENIPGKNKNNLLLIFEDNKSIYLAGNSEERVAHIELSIFGNKNNEGYDEFTKEVTKIYNEELNVPISNVYIKYDDIKIFGSYGNNFYE